MGEITRRQAVAWAVPVVAMAAAAPLAAASESASLASRLEFTNVTSTVGGKANTLYTNTKVKVIDGPDSVTNLTVTIMVGDHVESFVWPELPGWGVTPIMELESVHQKGDPVIVTFSAVADGCQPIFAQISVETPGWWK